MAARSSTGWKRSVTSSTRDSADRHLVDAALAEAERGGFRLAVLGWAGAMTAIAVFYFVTISGPNSIKVPAVAVALACIGLAPLARVGRRGERAGRFAFFAFNVLVVSGLLAVVPISSSGDVPQNFVFFSSRQHYYYVVVARIGADAFAGARPVDRSLRRRRAGRRHRLDRRRHGACRELPRPARGAVARGLSRDRARSELS